MCICHEACLPSFVASTLVWATPAKSPPQNTPGSDVSIVDVLTSGNPHLFSFNGAMADVTVVKEIRKLFIFLKQFEIVKHAD